MQATLTQVMNSVPTLRHLHTAESAALPIRARYHLGVSTIPSAQRHIEQVQRERQTARENAGLGAEDPDNEAVSAELSTLLESTVDIDGVPLPLSALEHTSLTSEQIATIDWLIKVDDPAD